MFDLINTKSWLEVEGPLLVTTGTWDSNAFFWPDWRAHLLSYETSKPDNKYSLVMDGSDHYLGNLICRLDREEASQHDALKMVNGVTTAFLDAYLKGDKAAAAYLRSDNLASKTSGFATLSSR